MNLENLVKIGKRVFIGSLMIGMLYGCSKDDNKKSPVQPQENHPPGFPRITHTIVDDYSGSTGLGVSMREYDIIGLWAHSVDPDGDDLEYYWSATGGKFENTGENYSVGYFTRWRAPEVDSMKDFYIKVYADDEKLTSDYNTLGVLVSPR